MARRRSQVEANFDQILALVRVLAERLGIYLLNSINPFRIEGQKSIIFEMLDQRDWSPPDWIVLPGGNLGNTSAFGKALRELREFGLIDKMPRLAVIQAEGAAPFYDFLQHARRISQRSRIPKTLATAIRIGDPVSWPKALHEVTRVERRGGKSERAGDRRRESDHRTLRHRLRAGLRRDAGRDSQADRGGRDPRERRCGRGADREVLKDPDYIYRYHTGQLKDPEGKLIESRFANRPVVVPNDADAIAKMLEEV